MILHQELEGYEAIEDKISVAARKAKDLAASLKSDPDKWPEVEREIEKLERDMLFMMNRVLALGPKDIKPAVAI